MNHMYAEIEENTSLSQKMIPARLELATFRVLGGRDNHYTTESHDYCLEFWDVIVIIQLDNSKNAKKILTASTYQTHC